MAVPGSEPEAPAAGQRGGWSLPELRVQLAMLLGENDAPAEVPGWGYLPAWQARQLVASMPSGQWRWVICDASGRAVDGGLTTIRPTTSTRTGDTSSSSATGANSGAGARVRRDPTGGGIVELAIRETDLIRLVHDPAAARAWTPVITDIARQHARGQPTGETHGGVGDGLPGGTVADDGSSDAELTNTDTDTDRRAPGARLRRWIQLRDRSCQHPCCRAPAATTDVDHRMRWADGGATTAANLTPMCRHDHRLKDEAGWTITRGEPDTPSPDTPTSDITVWTSPLGRRHTSRPPPVILRPITSWPRDDDQQQPPPVSGWPACSCLRRPCEHTATDAEHAVTPYPQHRPAPSEQETEPAIYDNGDPPY